MTQTNKLNKLPSKHHYVPQFYLKGFSQDKSKIHVFDKKVSASDNHFRYQSIEAVGYENNLYTYINKDLEKETLEDFFSQIEGLAKIVIDLLEKQAEITPMQRGHLALFISLLWQRTPVFKNETLGAQEELAEKSMRMLYHFPQQKMLMKKFFEERGEQMSDDEIQDLIDYATDPNRNEIKVDFPPEHWIKQLLEFSDRIYPYLAHCEWEVKHAVTKYAFITSDNPFLLIPSEKPHPFYGIGLITPGVKKTIPLTSNMYLVMHEPHKEELIIRHTEADKDFFRKANTWTMRNAERFVFSPDLGKIEKMVKAMPEITKPRGKRYMVS